MNRKLTALFLALLLTLSILTGCGSPMETDPQNLTSEQGASQQFPKQTQRAAFDLADVPAYADQAYVAINDNVPYFTESDITTEPFETYAPLDSLGRCGVTYANVCRELMPTEKRGDIGQVKPTGWQTIKYDFVDGKYLYNRCHLIGYQLTAENANKQNLITGTRYLNIEGMLPFENLVADYVKETGNHVLYRVTPVFEGDNLVAAGVLMEGYSVEDKGEGVTFCVFAYNVQPGVVIDYATGSSTLASDKESQQSSGVQTDYVLNTASKKFHLPECSSVSKTKEENRRDYRGSRDDLIAQGYAPCGSCKP